jgi:hypothetical protein
MWCHNALKPGRLTILVLPEGAWEDLLNDSALTCEDKDARRVEWNLRSRLYTFKHFRDDTAIEGDRVIHKVIRSPGRGLEGHCTGRGPVRGSCSFDPVPKDGAHLARLHAPGITYDQEETLRHIQAMP